MTLSTSAIIVIVVLVSGLLVAILWSFSGYYSRTNTMEEAREQVSHEQGAYMRQVRLRTQQYAYAESVFGGNDGATTTRTSQVWSNTNGGVTGTTPNTPAAVAGGGPSRRMSTGYGQQAQNLQQENKDGARVNYSAYDEQTDYYEQQSPYGNHGYYEEYGYEQQSALPQQPGEKGESIPPHQQV